MSFTFWGAWHPEPLTRGFAPGQHWGLYHQTTTEASATTLAMSAFVFLTF